MGAVNEVLYLSLVQALTAADALVDYGIRHIADRDTVAAVCSTLRALDYPSSAESLERLAATLREHSVRVDA